MPAEPYQGWKSPGAIPQYLSVPVILCHIVEKDDLLGSRRKNFPTPQFAATAGEWSLRSSDHPHNTNFGER